MTAAEALRIAFLFAWALTLAAVEVEVEGAHGWAERLPTWFRVRGAAARAYGLAMGGRPLTGYHLFMFVLPLFGFHLPFVSGVPFGAAAELQVLATYVVWAIAWDFLWFVLNPAYGVRRFRRGNVWWYPNAWLGPFPVDYWAGVAGSFGLAAGAWRLAGSPAPLEEHGRLVAGLAVLCAATLPLAPLYHRWYRHVRRPGSDERGLARITPPPDDAAR